MKSPQKWLPKMAEEPLKLSGYYLAKLTRKWLLTTVSWVNRLSLSHVSTQCEHGKVVSELQSVHSSQAVFGVF
jgi:hypothetical protein